MQSLATKLAFVIPLRPKATCDNWEIVSSLCIKTVRSCLKNTSEHIRVHLIGHDAPDGLDSIHDSRLTFHTAIADPPSGFSGSVGMVDKWNKVFQGFIALQQNSPDYVMIVDADDWVSVRLYDYLATHAPQHGVILKDGYKYKDGAWFASLIQHTFNCGTNAVIAVNSITLPHEISDAAREACLPLKWGHLRIEAEMRAAGLPLDVLPFPGAVYIQHTEQHSTSVDLGRRNWVRVFGTRVNSLLRAIPTLPNQRFAARVLGDFQ